MQTIKEESKIKFVDDRPPIRTVRLVDIEISISKYDETGTVDVHINLNKNDFNEVKKILHLKEESWKGATWLETGIGRQDIGIFLSKK